MLKNLFSTFLLNGNKAKRFVNLINTKSYFSTLYKKQNFKQISNHKNYQILTKMNTELNLKQIYEKLNEFAPLSLAEAWDNVGFLVEPSSQIEIKKIFLTNDLTEDVVDEAIENNINLIITYHPIIFKPVNRISSSDWKGRVISKCLENKIFVFSPHSTWDNTQNGLSDWLAKSLPIKNSAPITFGPLPNTGLGRICTVNGNITLKQAIDLVKKHLDVNYLQVGIARGKTLNDLITTYAVCAGSGASVLTTPADLYITGEMSHHEVLNATHNGTHVILSFHSNSERGFLKVIATKLSTWFPNIEVLISKKDKDPLVTL